jgi:hypothetical protein
VRVMEICGPRIAVFLYTRIEDNSRLKRRGTSGIIDVMVAIARERGSFELRQFGASRIGNCYLCLTHGSIEQPSRI